MKKKLFIITMLIGLSKTGLSAMEYEKLALNKAIKADDVAEVKEKLFNVDRPVTSDGESALCFAAREGAVETARMLLKKGADIEATGKKQWTPLNLAANNGRLDMVKLLVKKGAYVDTKDTTGWTPLISALYHRYADLAKYLIKKGADVDIKNQDGRNALYYAKKNQLDDVVDLLEKRRRK